MEDTKSILASKTFWAAAIVLVSIGLQLSGIKDASGYANDAPRLTEIRDGIRLAHPDLALHFADVAQSTKVGS